MRKVSKVLLVLSFICSGISVFAQVSIVREGESADSLRSPMAIYPDSNASNGYYLSTHTSYAGEADFDVYVPVTSAYTLSARVKATSGSQNSFYVAVDAGAEQAWHLSTNDSYTWRTFSNVLQLNAGTHRIRIVGRESYTRLDILQLYSATAVATPAPTPTPTPTPTPVLDPAKAPGENFALSTWYLTLPVDSSETFTGTAAMVNPIPATYQQWPYFYTGSDGAAVFMAPTDGATTSGSHYPRSELRELNADGSLAAWTVAKGGSFSATLAVNELPVTSTGRQGRIVIGQIHGPKDELCRLYYDNGKLYFHDDKSGSTLVEKQYDLKSAAGATSQIPLNAQFSYSIRATSSTLTVTATYNGVAYSASEPISSFWPGLSLYFKAGDYVQVGLASSGAGTIGTGQGQVSFYRINKPTHP